METIKLAVLLLLMWLCLGMSYIRSMKSQMLFYCLLFSLAVNAQRKIERTIAKEPAFSGAQVSISVFDLKKQKQKVSFRSDINILPASTIKLVTFLGALQAFQESLTMLH
jgi:D-alanyl-D-alanine carboxypeptidase